MLPKRTQNSDRNTLGARRAGLRMAGMALLLLLAASPFLGQAAALCNECHVTYRVVRDYPCFVVYVDGVRWDTQDCTYVVTGAIGSGAGSETCGEHRSWCATQTDAATRAGPVAVAASVAATPEQVSYDATVCLMLA